MKNKSVFFLTLRQKTLVWVFPHAHRLYLFTYPDAVCPSQLLLAAVMCPPSKVAPFVTCKSSKYCATFMLLETGSCNGYHQEMVREFRFIGNKMWLHKDKSNLFTFLAFNLINFHCLHRNFILIMDLNLILNF